MKRLVLLVLFLGGALSALAQEPPAPAATDTATAPQKPLAPPLARELKGTLSWVGNSPFGSLLLTSQEGEKLSISGALLPELGQLAGLTLRLFGRSAGTDGGNARFEVLSYEILDCGDGSKPYLGTLTLEKDKLLLQIKDAGPGFALNANRKVLEVLKAAVGAKAWVSGELKDGALKVRRYKVLAAN